MSCWICLSNDNRQRSYYVSTWNIRIRSKNGKFHLSMSYSFQLILELYPHQGQQRTHGHAIFMGPETGFVLNVSHKLNVNKTLQEINFFSFMNCFLSQ